jgi:hypothetical protein
MFANSLHGQSISPNAPSAAPPTPISETIDSIAESLAGYAVKDFLEHQPPLPIKFRKVRVGHLISADGSRSYRLCGDFLATDGGDKKLRWMSFVTIKTAPYEQYIGSSTLSFCIDKKMIWDRAGDLTSLMNKKLGPSTSK